MLFYNFQNVKVEGFMQIDENLVCPSEKKLLSWYSSSLMEDLSKLYRTAEQWSFCKPTKSKILKSLEKHYKQAFLRHVFPNEDEVSLYISCYKWTSEHTPEVEILATGQDPN